jgi:hypothetical protein
VRWRKKPARKMENSGERGTEKMVVVGDGGGGSGGW